MSNNLLIVKWWSEKLQLGINDIRTCIGIVDGKVVRFKAEVNNGTLRYRYEKKVVTYLKIKNSITHRDFMLSEYCPF